MATKSTRATPSIRTGTGRRSEFTSNPACRTGATRPPTASSRRTGTSSPAASSSPSGRPEPLRSQTVAQLIGNSGSGTVTEIAFGAARALQYAAVALAVGALVFLLLSWLPGLGAVAGSDGSWLRASQAFSASAEAAALRGRGHRGSERSGRRRPGGGGGRRDLGLLRAPELDHSRGARDEVRDDLGALPARVGWLRGDPALRSRAGGSEGLCPATRRAGSNGACQVRIVGGDPAACRSRSRSPSW